MVFLNQARASGSPVSFGELEHDVVDRVAPLAERHEVVEHSNTTSLWAKYSPSPAFLIQYQAKVFSGFGVLPLAMSASLSSIHDFRKSRCPRTVM